MEQIEDVIDDWQLREPSVLQLLKVRSAGFVQGNNLTVKHSLSQFQPLESLRNVRIFGSVVEAGHREELRASAVDHGNDSITVLLRFVDPSVTLRQFGNTLAFHRLDESRTQFGSDSNSLNHYRRTIFSHVLG